MSRDLQCLSRYPRRSACLPMRTSIRCHCCSRAPGSRLRTSTMSGCTGKPFCTVRPSIGHGRSATAQSCARATGIAVVNDFRSADVAAGGQGAPFAPLYHLVLSRNEKRPVAVVNIGGVGNVTYIGANDEVIAFDTGPGNAALDDWAFAHTGIRADMDGRLARAGRVDETRLAELLNHPMFSIPPPKSLDRFDFPMTAVDGLSGPDGAATLTAFTAASIARAREHLPASTERMDYLWRRTAQSRADGRTQTPAWWDGQIRRGCRLARRFHRGRSVRLSRCAQCQRTAAHSALDNRRPLPDARRPIASSIEKSALV